MCSWRYRVGHTSSCRYVWPQRLFGKSRRNPHQHFITTQSVKIRHSNCLMLYLVVSQEWQSKSRGLRLACPKIPRARFIMQHLTTIRKLLSKTFETFCINKALRFALNTHAFEIHAYRGKGFTNKNFSLPDSFSCFNNYIQHLYSFFSWSRFISPKKLLSCL